LFCPTFSSATFSSFSCIFLIERDEFCIREKFQASCSSTLSSLAAYDGLPPPEGRIVMKYARYGRTRFGRCIQKQFDGYHGCSVDVLDTMHRMCSGRPSCSVDVFQTFSWLRPCSELESFLDVEYECILGKLTVPLEQVTKIALNADCTERWSKDSEILLAAHQ